MPTCHYHPNVETLVSCGRCGKPLCPDCVGHGATGVRCKECLRQTPRALGMASGRQIIVAAVIALVVGLALGGIWGFFLWRDFFSGLVMGFVVASAAFLGSRRHRDPAIQAIALVAALASIAVAALLPLALLPGPGMKLAQYLAQYGRGFLPPLVGAVIGAIARFRV
jgi:hypothetical protein